MNRHFWLATLVAIVGVGIGMSLLEAVSGDGFWAPLVYIGATVFRAYQNTIPPIGFAVSPVVAGLILHVIVSLIGTAILSSLTIGMSRGGAVIGGALFGLIFFAAMWYVALPVINPVMLNLNMWYMMLTHIAWGAIAGPLLATGESPRYSGTSPRPTASRV